MRKSRRRATRRKVAVERKSGPRAVSRRIIERPVPSAPKDMVEARKSISDFVRGSVMEIIDALIDKAEDGEVGPAKYLFEMVGLYPATEETSSKPEDSLAYTLLQRMGLPTELEGPGDTQGRSGQQASYRGD